MSTPHAIAQTGGTEVHEVLETKAAVIEELGPTQSLAAQKLRITQSALSQWPAQLKPHHQNVVDAARWRIHRASQQSNSGE
jgi:hypothetical protein